MFSNSFLVQHTEHEFIITFAHVQPPITLSEADIGKIHSVPAKVAVRIAMPPSRLQELIAVLTRNFATFEERLRSLNEAAGRRAGGPNATDQTP
ncbi:MAG: DUF3467 domain-containing protein [Candidatus Rokubacteria bacterium]|nr:DUF3467 domain-containing protein [Candidatus Rokubacteria bacterium]